MRPLPPEFDVRFTLPADAPEILKDLRKYEKRSVELLNMNPVFQLNKEIAESQYCFTGTVGGKMAVIWGIKQPSLISDTAHLWAITTTLVDKYPFVFLRHSREFISQMESQYRILNGYVIDDYERSKKWLRWLGFAIEPPQRFEKMKLCRFEKKRA